MKRRLAILLLAIFCLQALPVKALYKQMIKSQTEEVSKDCCDDDCDDCDDEDGDDAAKNTHFGGYTPICIYSAANTCHKLRKSRLQYCPVFSIGSAYISEIPVPPPNR